MDKEKRGDDIFLKPENIARNCSSHWVFFFLGSSWVRPLEYPNLFSIENIINKMKTFEIYINIQYFCPKSKLKNYFWS